MILLTSLSSIFVNVQAQQISSSQIQAQQVPSESQTIDASLGGPIFLNAYWTNQGASSTLSSSSSNNPAVSARREVGPGEGAATLAVVLVNRGVSDITGIIGHLTLPDGFSANGRSSSETTADASFDNIVKAGDTFTLYFDLNVSNNTRVGPYNANLDVEYNRIVEQGSPRHNGIIVPFMLTGKVVLSAIAQTHNLVPGITNNVNFQIRNSGTAAATGVVVSIAGISSTSSRSSNSNVDTSTGATTPITLSGSDGQIINFGTTTYNVGTIGPGSSVSLSSNIFPSDSAGGATASMQLVISYNDAYGNTQTITPGMGLVILPSAPSVIAVKGSSADGNGTENRLVAGKIDGFILDIANKGKVPINNAVVSLTSQSDSIKILGDSKWTVETIDANSETKLPTQIFAAPSLIGTPASFSVTVDYLLNGESKSEQFVLGTYVDGDITLRVYDLAINSVGNTPTLVGNILNQGTTTALFTTIETVPQLSTVNSNNSTSFSGGSYVIGQQYGQQQSQSQSEFRQRSGQQSQFRQQSSAGGQQGLGQQQQPSSQYLGDLTADSPLPFNLPLNSVRGLPGPYPVTLKITYQDGLRNTHEFITSQNVSLSQNAQFGNNNPGFRNRSQGMDMLIPIIIGVAAAAAIAAVIIIKRKRKTNSRKLQDQNNGHDDHSGNIEDILTNPASETNKYHHQQQSSTGSDNTEK